MLTRASPKFVLIPSLSARLAHLIKEKVTSLSGYAFLFATTNQPQRRTYREMSNKMCKKGEIRGETKYAISRMRKKHQKLDSNDAPSIKRYGFLVRPNGQVVAVR